MTSPVPHAPRTERGGSPIPRAESVRGIDALPRPAAWPGAGGSARVAHTPSTGIPQS